MTPRITILAVLLAAGPPAAFAAAPATLDTAKTAARAHFLSHEAGQPTIEAAVKLPEQPADQVSELKVLLDSAREIQLGCVLPCATPEDALIYRGKIELVATKLSLDAAGLKAAGDRYVPGGKPRLRSAKAGGNSNSDKMVEAKVVEQMLRDPHMPADVRQRMAQKARSYADALGQMRFEDGAAGGVSAGGTGRRLTTQEIAELNKIPQAQAQLLRSIASRAPPAVELTADQKQEASMRECEEQIKSNPGTVRQARNFWIAESQDKNSNVLWRGYAYLNRGLLAVSGLTEVEESAARTGWALASNEVSARRATWESTKLATNSVMFALNFVGFSGAGQVLGKARALDNPVVIDGLKEVGQQAATQITKRAAGISEVTANALGKGRDYKAATAALNDFALAELGGVVKVERGGKVGMAVFEAGKDGMPGVIKYNPLIGESHEFAHAQQMLVNRASALEVVASKAGKPIEKLTQAEVESAMQLADRFETAYYAQHEAQAFRSSGFLGLTPGSNYGTKLGTNAAELASTWAGKPQFSFSKGQRLFGALSGLGDSQGKIALSLAAHANVPIVRQGYTTIIDAGAKTVGDMLPPPDLPSQRNK